VFFFLLPFFIFLFYSLLYVVTIKLSPSVYSKLVMMFTSFGFDSVTFELSSWHILFSPLLHAVEEYIGFLAAFQGSRSDTLT